MLSKTEQQKVTLTNYLLKWRSSPLAFIEDVWKLTPERDNKLFQKGKHITWQQHDVLFAVEKALRGEAPRRISVASGHGVGKSTVISWLLLWFLLCFKEAQIGATAPTTEQMHDVLWKEAKKWLDKMPPAFQDKYEWITGYIRFTERPKTWFARARTARKEAPEAFAGLHGDNVMLIGDEASGIADEIYNVAEGSLTDKNTLTLLIGNPTRISGYFFNTHNRDKQNWQTLTFSAIDSPLVDRGYVERIIALHGEDSDEYKIRVLGQFPTGEGMQDGWLPMFNEADIQEVSDVGPFMKPVYLGVDPSGLGRNKSVWCLRDAFKAKIADREAKSSSMTVAERTITLGMHYEVPPANVKIDNFGAGANVAQEIALADHTRVHAINVGSKPKDERFLNVRAEMYWLLREWLKKGGKLVRGGEWRQLLTIRYNRTLQGKIRVMSKEDMIKKGFESPDDADALALTFVPSYVGSVGIATRSFGEELSDKEIADIVNVY